MIELGVCLGLLRFDIDLNYLDTASKSAVSRLLPTRTDLQIFVFSGATLFESVASAIASGISQQKDF